jgi:hypothetical protein
MIRDHGQSYGLRRSSASLVTKPRVRVTKPRVRVTVCVTKPRVCVTRGPWVPGREGPADRPGFVLAGPGLRDGAGMGRAREY